MRFTLTLAVDRQKEHEPVIPINYQYELSSWIYKTVNNSDKEFATWLHHNGYNHENRRFKFFTFSHLKPQKYQVMGDRLLILSEHVNLIVSFYLPVLVEHFVTGLFKNQQFSIGDKKSRVDFTVQQIEKLPDIDFPHEVHFRAVSPVIISKNTESGQRYAQYISPEDEQFGDAIITNLVNKYVALAQQGVIMGSMLPATDDRMVRFEYCNGLKQKLIRIKAGDKGETFLKGYLFDFKLTAPVELMKIGYYGGFGEKNSLGFGCCEVIKT